jgi:hypothetical protein
MRTVLNDFRDVVEAKTLHHSHINLDKDSKESVVTKDFMLGVVEQLNAGNIH